MTYSEMQDLGDAIRLAITNGICEVCDRYLEQEVQLTRLDIAARMVPLLVHRCQDNYYNCTVLSDEHNAEELLKMADVLIAVANNVAL